MARRPISSPEPVERCASGSTRVTGGRSRHRTATASSSAALPSGGRRGGGPGSTPDGRRRDRLHRGGRKRHGPPRRLRRAAAALPAAPSVAVDPSAVAALFYTSGTTGRPKGAELTPSGARRPGWDRRRWSRPTRAATGRCVIGLPVAHIDGLRPAVGSWRPSASPVYLLAEVPPRRRRSMPSSGTRPTIFVGVPAMYRMLLRGRRRGARPVVGAGVGHRAPTPCRRTVADAFQGMGATFGAVPVSAPSARRSSSRATAWSSSAAGRPIRLPPSVPLALRRAEAAAGRPFRGASTRRGGRSPKGEVGELAAEGAGRDAGLPRRR